MLDNILENFSEDELYGLLPRTTVEFALDISKKNDPNELISKKLLARLIATNKGPEFLFNDELRTKLIERMPPKLLTSLFPELDVTESQVKPAHYNVASEWIKFNLADFAARLGLSEMYEDHMQPDIELKSISRINPIYALYPYQIDISDRVLKNMNNGLRRQLIHLPTGAGKTRTAMNIAAMHLRQNPNNLVLWFADREELCSQAFSEFESAWTALGNRPSSLYAFYSNSDESLSGIDSGFIVGGLHKFLSIRNKDSNQYKILYAQLRRSVTLVVFDEAHKAIAPTYRQVVEDFIESAEFDANLVGLTATPGRKFLPDGLSDEDQRLSSFFYGNKVSMSVPGYLSPIDYLVEQQYLAKAEFLSLNYDHSGILAYELSDAGGPKTIKALSNNRERNIRILETVKRECKLGSFIILFACTVEHAVNLAAAIALEGINAASIDSKNDTSESRRAKIAQYKAGRIQVLVNFNVLTAGFDAPRTNVAVIAKPMDSLVQYLQMAGRAMRGFKSGGNNNCKVYTVMDDIPQFRSVNLAFEYWNDMWKEE